MSKKVAILGLATVALIAVAAVSYFGYTLTGPVDAANLGAVAARTGSSFNSPKVELSVATGDRIDWDFRDVESQYRERDSQGNWVNGTHVLQTQYCQGGAHPQDHAMAGKKMADFGLTNVGDNGYLLQGTFTAPPRDNNGDWEHRPFHRSVNPSGTERVNKWRMRVRQVSRTDVDDSMPLAALKKDGNYAGPREQCFYGQTYRFTVTHRVRVTPTPTPDTRCPPIHQFRYQPQHGRLMTAADASTDTGTAKRGRWSSTTKTFTSRAAKCPTATTIACRWNSAMSTT